MLFIFFLKNVFYLKILWEIWIYFCLCEHDRFFKLKKIDAEILECKNSDVSVFLFNDGTKIEENDYLINLEDWTELFIFKQCQKKKVRKLL